MVQNPGELTWIMATVTSDFSTALKYSIVCAGDIYQAYCFLCKISFWLISLCYYNSRSPWLWWYWPWPFTLLWAKVHTPPKFTFRSKTRLRLWKILLDFIWKTLSAVFSLDAYDFDPVLIQGHIGSFIGKKEKKPILYCNLFNNCTVYVQTTAEHSAIGPMFWFSVFEKKLNVLAIGPMPALLSYFEIFTTMKC